MSRRAGALSGILFGALFGTASLATERWQIADSNLDALDELLVRHADDFGGLSVDPDTQRVIVRVVAGRDQHSIQQKLADLPVDSAIESERQWTIALQPVLRSSRTLESVRTQILTREPWASQVKPVISQFHVDVDRNVVSVGVTSITPQLRQAAHKAFGTAVELYETPRHRFFSRAMPSQERAMSAGAIIKMPNGRHCASGFSVQGRIGTITFKGFTTAGHCVWDLGASVRVNDDAGTYLGMSMGHRVGIAMANQVVSWPQDTDSALVIDPTFVGSMQAEPRSYVGGTTSRTRRFVIGERNARVGDRVCFSGPYTGENCTAVVQNLNATAAVFIDGVFPILVPGLVEARSSNGSNIAQPGDSGGPVYIKDTFGLNQVVYAVGTIEAGPVHAPSPVVLYVPIFKVVPTGFSVWHVSCSQTSCSF